MKLSSTRGLRQWSPAAESRRRRWHFVGEKPFEMIAALRVDGSIDAIDGNKRKRRRIFALLYALDVIAACLMEIKRK